MPSSVTYAETVRVFLPLGASGKAGVPFAVSVLSFNPTVTLAVPPRPDTLLTACRQKIVATFPARFLGTPETLEQLTGDLNGKLPTLVLSLQASVDVSSQYPVFTIATQYTVQFVYISRQVANQDTEAVLRQDLQTLLDAFYADWHLGGLAARTDVVQMPAEKSNEYKEYFTQQGIAVSLSVLTMALAFTLVEDIPNAT